MPETFEEMTARLKSMVPERSGEAGFMACPFCPREPKITVRGSSDYESSTTGYVFFAACHGERCSAHAHQFAYSLNELREKWNTRPDVQLASLRGRVAELEARLEASEQGKSSPGPATRAMVDYCRREEADNGHMWDEDAAKIIREFIEEAGDE